MERIDVAGWVLECEPEVTRAVLGALPAGAPEACGCLHCRNYALARPRVYGPRMRALLARLGVPEDRETEVYELGPGAAPGLRLYGGWFTAAGRVLRDPLADVPPAERAFVALDPGLEVAAAPGGVLAPDGFAGRPVLQLVFHAQVPWLLDEPPDPTGYWAPAG